MCRSSSVTASWPHPQACSSLGGSSSTATATTPRDAASALALNIEDRGAGWEPPGWTITTALGTKLGQVDGNVILSRTHEELSAFFPKGFGDMLPPFYWYANEWEIRAFLPTNNPDKPNYAVNGSESFDCPTGTDASGLPDPKLLLHATS